MNGDREGRWFRCGNLVVGFSCVLRGLTSKNDTTQRREDSSMENVGVVAIVPGDPAEKWGK